VRVPGAAGKGSAKVSIHIPDWKEEKLPPATFVVPVHADSNKIQVAKPWKGTER
jgi:hypothetical protein